MQQELLDNPDNLDPKVINALATITRDRSHQIIAAQSKLDKRYSDKQKIELNDTRPMIIGWETGPSDVEKMRIIGKSNPKGNPQLDDTGLN